MTDTLMPSGTHVEIRAAVVTHSDVAVMNGPSIDGTKYFIIFIFEASGHERAFHIKSKVKAAELLMRQAG